MVPVTSVCAIGRNRRTTGRSLITVVDEQLWSLKKWHVIKILRSSLPSRLCPIGPLRVQKRHVRAFAARQLIGARYILSCYFRSNVTGASTQRGLWDFLQSHMNARNKGGH